MFYSIYIEGQNIEKSSNLSDDNYVYDIEKEELIEDYVIPYLNQEEFIFNGRTISKDGISVFLIKESEKTLKVLLKEVEKKMEAEGRFGLVFKSFIFSDDEYTKDVTKSIFKEIQGKIKKNNVKIDKKNETNIKVSNKVFIVHGRDNELKEEVARFIEKLGLEAIILHEQANNGKTIIEKFEKNSSEIGYAIILYTACDKGCLKNEDNFKYRARQNVIFEHGYFIGKIGREKVCALVKGDIEKPSDLDGVLYISYDNHWKMFLASEMKVAGLPIDMNKLF